MSPKILECNRRSGKESALPLVTLKDQNNLRLISSVLEANLPYLNPENEINFNVRSQPNATFNGKISR